jgi:transposase
MIKAVPQWVITQLETWRVIIEAIEEQLGKIEAELRARDPRQLIFGEGELTHELLARELIDPKRFRNARPVGNYSRLCPSESTSEQRRRLGAITKHGNPRLRRLLVELAWRISRFQSNYRGLRQWGALLENRNASAAARKKAIVALARQLAVDLWRMATERVQAQELGLVTKVRLN